MYFNTFNGIFPYLDWSVGAAGGRVNEVVLRRLVSHLIDFGVIGLSPLGSTVEFAYLSYEQCREPVRIVVDETAGRVPVVPGVPSYATHDALRHADVFVMLGADGLVLILQTLFPASARGMEGYFRQREATSRTHGAVRNWEFLTWPSPGLFHTRWRSTPTPGCWAATFRPTSSSPSVSCRTSATSRTSQAARGAS